MRNHAHGKPLKGLVDVLHGLDLILGELALARLGTPRLALKEGLAVLVDLELGDDDLGGVDANVDGGAVHLLAGDALDVDDPLLAVHLDDLALATLVVTPHDSHLVVLADRNRANLMVRRERGEEVSACWM